MTKKRGAFQSEKKTVGGGLISPLSFLCLAALWGCVFIGSLNPLRIQGVLSNVTLYRLFSAGIAGADAAQSRTLTAALLALAILYIGLTLFFLLGLTGGRLYRLYRLFSLSAAVLLCLFYLCIAGFMLATGRSILGAAISCLAALAYIALHLRLRYRAPRGSAGFRRGYTAAVLLLTAVCGALLWLRPGSGALSVNFDEEPTLGVIYEDPDMDGVTTGAKAVDGQKKKGLYTFILTGLDVSYHTDTLLVARLDAEQRTLDVVSIPRDTMVNVTGRKPAYQAVKKINGAFLSGYDATGKREEGIQLLRSELKSILGFTPSYYIIISLDCFVELIDAIGGVDYYVKRDYYYVDLAQDLYIDLKQGQQLLDGEKAIQLVRYRNELSDADRISETQAFLSAAAEQALQSVNLTTLDKIIDILENEKMVQTNIPGSDMLTFGEELLKIKPEDISFSVMPHTFVTYKGGSYAHVNGEAFVELINERLNPYDVPISLENLNLLLLK